MDHALVFGTTEPLEPMRSWIGSGPGRLVEVRLQGLHQRQEGVGFGAGGAGGRHHPQAQLGDHLLGQLGAFLDMGEVQTRHAHVAGHLDVVVTVNTVLVDDRLLGFGRQRGGFRTDHPNSAVCRLLPGKIDSRRDEQTHH